MPNYHIAPSILAADFAKLGAEVEAVMNAGADIIHIDVMDNHYVPNLTLGPMVCQALKNYGIQAPLDVHLMIKPVDAMVPAFVQAGAHYISFHPEASEHVHRTLQLIHGHGCQAGLAFNPATPLHYLENLIDDLDSVLIMAVNPGFGGQQFIPQTLQKISQAATILAQSKREIRLEVDGGVNIANIAAIAKAGADTFVAGSAIFHSQDYQQTIQALRDALNGVN